MRLKEIADLLNAAQVDIEEWMKHIELDETYDDDAIKESRELARRLGEAANFIEGELL